MFEKNKGHKNGFYVRSLLRLASACAVIMDSATATEKAIKRDFWLIFGSLAGEFNSMDLQVNRILVAKLF